MDARATALESDDRSWTYRELDEAVERRAVALDSGGVTPGRVVPLVVRQDAESVIDLLAHWRAGVTPAPLNSRLSSFEREAASSALTGIEEMKKSCDTLLVIPNETLLEITDDNTTVTESFKLADSVLHQATKGISDLINIPGLINLDFADVKTVMENMGDAIMGTGIAHGEERAILAAQQAINSPLLQDTSITGSQGLLVNITGPENMTIHELNDASSIIYEEAGADANVILGCVLDKNLSDEVRVTVIATGLNSETKREYNSIPHTMKSDYSLPRGKNDSDVDDDRIPAFRGAPQLSEESENNPNLFENEDSNGDSSDPVITFGDDLDVPAFIRNRQE